MYKDTHRTQVRRYDVMNEKLMRPRLNLIKKLCAKKYGERYYTATEMNIVIAENGLHLYHSNGSSRPEKQIQDAMSIAHKKLKQQESRKIEHHPSCGCLQCAKFDKEGEHIVVNPHS